jgi:hypothetical protein
MNQYEIDCIVENDIEQIMLKKSLDDIWIDEIINQEQEVINKLRK